MDLAALLGGLILCIVFAVVLILLVAFAFYFVWSAVKSFKVSIHASVEKSPDEAQKK